MENLSITEIQAAQLAQRYYGLNGQAKTLPGEVDFNFRIDTSSGERYTLKLSRPETAPDELDFQVAILQHLAEQEFPYDIPAMIKAQNGRYRLAITDGQGRKRWLRLQRWVGGRMLGHANPRGKGLLYQWGECCGQLAKALQGFDHPFAHRFYKWNPSETLASRPLREFITEPDRLAIADAFWQLFEKETLPKLGSLRKSVNYNDAHEMNLLVDHQLDRPRLSGVIDFGDALYTQTINELAIACAYAGMECPDPLQAVKQVVAGFHKVFPLQEEEVGVLYSLISARLLITVANAAKSKHAEPDNEYLLVSEQPAWGLLKKWINISPTLAHYTFRHACGWEVHPQLAAFENWAKRIDGSIAPIIHAGSDRFHPLDLSVGSLALGNNGNFQSIPAFDRCIQRMLEDAGAQVGIGGYGEVRPFYTTDAYQVEGNEGAQWRTVHLGVDFWAPAGTPVVSPLDGKVVSVQDNAGERDYGPTIILQHRVSETLSFYSLYGHLNKDCLQQWKTGDTIAKGQEIAQIGPPPENGNWPPHLHFQLMLDLLDTHGDFPGVAYPQEREVWQSICPDPYWLFPHLVNRSNPKLTIADILDDRRLRLGRSLSISYANPLHIVRGFGTYLYDISGRRYLDTVNNVAHVGHEQPEVVRAAQQQAAVLNTNTRYLHENLVRFADELLATLPDELCVVHFVNSGSEANELALRMARTYSGQKDMLAIEVGYHGNTNACIEVSSYKFDGKGGQGAPPHTHIIPLPDVYRGRHRESATAGKEYARYAQMAIANIQSEGRNIAGFIGESILSCGGQIVPPSGYFEEVYRHVRTAGGLCIADEVQVGFGRVGDAFWGFELHDVVPDIVTMGKPIGNGHPLGAVVTTRAVADAFANGMEYFNTFGGNPVSCAIGRAVLKVVSNEQHQDHARSVGGHLLQGLRDLQREFPLIGDVRGHGLFLGFELMRGGAEGTPAAAEARYLANRMRQRGILMSTDGSGYNVLKIKPPMTFSRSQADFFLENLSLVFREDFMQ